MEPINVAFARQWPEARRMNLLDDSLSVDLALRGSLDEAIGNRFLALADYAVSAGAQALLFTSSAFGLCIEAVERRHQPLPVLKPYQAMIDIAAQSRKRIGLIASFEPTLRSMPADFPANVPLDTELAEGALDALSRGDAAAHDRAVISAAERLRTRGCQLIALAQFSMARAAAAVGTAVSLPVLTSVDSCVAQLRQRLGA
jgi:aspartate/glutamate racemase